MCAVTGSDSPSPVNSSGVASVSVSVVAGSVVRVTATATDADFAALTDPLRPELTAHCYRMLGSLHDAEDQVQETYLRAWRAFHAFEGRSSVRTWMYQIATRTCLTALEQRKRRPMPTGLGQPRSDPRAEITARDDVPWLEPVPSAVLTGTVPADPADVAASREGIRLAFVAALQHLTPLQRAVVVLRDVLAYSAAETADLLGITLASANSALQRARARLERLAPEAATPVAAELTEREHDLLGRYIAAFEAYDVDDVVSLLAAEVTWEMPPFEGWYRGREDIRALISTQCPAKHPGDLRCVPTSANGQPALGMYYRQPDGDYAPFQLHVLDVVDGAISHVRSFFDTGLFDDFGLPARLPA